MKKILFKSALIIALALWATGSNAQEQDSTVYFECNFDKGIPAEFSLYDLDQQTLHFSMIQGGIKQGEAWARKKETGTQNYYAVSACRYKEIEGVELKPSDDWLITPAIWVRGKEANLSWISRSFKSMLKVGASYEVLISTTGNTPQDFTQPAIFSTPEETLDKWVEHNIDLSAYEGQHIYIAFHNNSAQGDFIAIDNLVVKGHRGICDMVATTPQNLFASNTLNVTLSITSYSDEPITDMTLYYRHNDQTISATLSQLDIKKYEVFNYTFDTPINIAYNDTAHYHIGATVNGIVQDEIACTTIAYLFKPTHKIVVEEGTGMWCTFCPRGIVAMEIVKEKYPENFVGIAVHCGNDPLTINNYPVTFVGLPSAWINRKLYDDNLMMKVRNNNVEEYVTTNGGMETLFLEELNAIPLIDVNIKNISFNDNKVSLNTTIRSLIDLNDKAYQLQFAVVEDNVWQNGYYQKNGYADSDIPLHGWENKNDMVYDYVFEHVARTAYYDYEGCENSVPTNFIAGEEYDNSFTFDLPSNILNIQNVKFVAMIVNTEDGYIINADESEAISAIHAVETSLHTLCYTDGNNINISLPSTAPAQVAIYNTTGSLVASHIINDTTAQVAAPNNGIYILTITQGNSTSIHKIVVR